MDLRESHNELLRRAADPATPASELDTLAKNLLLQLVVARNPAAGSATLERLSATAGDSAILEAVAAHPNTPLTILLRLARRFPKAFLANPALLLHLLEQPDFPVSIPDDTLKGLVTDPAAPAGLLGVLTRHERADIADAARWHISLAGEADASWAERIDEALWQIKIVSSATQIPTLLAMEAVPAWLMPPLLIGDSLALRQAAAASPVTPPELLAALRQAGASPDLSAEAAPDPALEPRWLERLALGGVWSCGLVAVHPVTPPALLSRLASHSSGRIRRLVAQNPQTPPSVLPRLAGDKERQIRQAVTRHPDAPPAVLARLAQDRQISVSSSAATHPNLPLDALERLARANEWQIRQGVAKNPSTPAHVLELLAQDSERSVVYEVARHPALPTPLMATLAQHPILAVQAIIDMRTRGQSIQPPRSAPAPLSSAPASSARRTSALSAPIAAPAAQEHAPASADHLGVYAESADPLLRRIAAGQRDTPAELLAILAQDVQREVRETAAGNPSTPAATLEALAQGEIGGDNDHRIALVNNPSLPDASFARLLVGLAPEFALRHPLITDGLRQAVLERVMHSCLSNSWLPPIAHAICLAHPQCSPAELERWSSAFAWLSRYAIVRNPVTPTTLLERLADDVHALVRAAARAALAQREQAAE